MKDILPELISSDEMVYVKVEDRYISQSRRLMYDVHN